jgi:hypothetical protein|tara:strand:- start:7127 stop:7483 length:357 start_codon:yes stop_codon:yes gene_type:complete
MNTLTFRKEYSEYIQVMRELFGYPFDRPMFHEVIGRTLYKGIPGQETEQKYAKAYEHLSRMTRSFPSISINPRSPEDAKGSVGEHELLTLEMNIAALYSVLRLAERRFQFAKEHGVKN